MVDISLIKFGLTPFGLETSHRFLFSKKTSDDSLVFNASPLRVVERNNISLLHA